MLKVFVPLAFLLVTALIIPRVRSVVFHSHVLRFLRIFCAILLLVCVGIAGYFAWKLWWPKYMAKPTVEWRDTTVEQEQNPLTPHTGKSSSFFRATNPIRWLSAAKKTLYPAIAEAAPPTSDTYRMSPDVLDAGGLDVSKSSQYLLSDSIGESVVGFGASNTYKLESGYRQPSAAEFLSMTCSSTAVIGSVVASGQKTGSGTCVVYSDAYNGYNLSWGIFSGSGGVNTGSLISQYNDTIAPYTPASANTPETWSVGAADAEWGARLRSSSTDTQAEWGTDGGSEKWLNIAAETNRTIVVRSSATPQEGSVEIIQFRSEVGSSAFQPSGTYQATTVFTVVGF